MKFLLRTRTVLKTFYGKYNIYLDGLLRFVFALLSFMTVFYYTGYNQTLTSPVIAVMLALVCAFMPISAIPILTCLLIVAEFLSVSMEVAAITVVIMVMMLLLYFIFRAGDSWMMVLTMLTCLWGIPAVCLPVALLIAPIQVIVVVFGCVLYGLIAVVKKDVSVLSSQTGSLSLAGRVNLLLNDLVTNQRLLLVLTVLAASMIMIAFIRRAKMDRAGTVAMIIGTIIFFVGLLLGSYTMELTVNYYLLGISLVISSFTAFLILYIFKGLDFKRTEEVQFEDDDYYYFVKAVPKTMIPVTKKKEEVITKTKLDTFSINTDELFRKHRDEQKGEENE